MLLWEKPLPVLSLNRDPLTSFNAPVFPQRDQKGCSKTSTGLTRSITSTPHRQAFVFHSNQRAHARRRQNFLNDEVTAQPGGPWITGKSAPSLHPFMLLWEKPLPVLSLNRDPLTSFNAPVFPQRDQKGCSKTSTGFTRSITSTPHRQAFVFPFKSTCTR